MKKIEPLYLMLPKTETKEEPLFMKIVVTDLLPEDQKTKFMEWMYGQTGIMYENHFCAYYYDYERWFKHEEYNNKKKINEPRSKRKVD